MSPEDAFYLLSHDDNAIRQHTSIEGRAVLLILCAESAILAHGLERMDRTAIGDCYRFIETCIRFLEGENVSTRIFEEFIANADESHGFMLHMQVERTKFWDWFLAMTAWFATVAAASQEESSYLADGNDCSIAPMFSECVQKAGGDFGWMYCAEVFRFVVATFPNRNEEFPLQPVNFCLVRLALLKHLASIGASQP